MADNDTTITLVGRIGQEPELRTTPQGSDVLNFRVATTERKRDTDGSWSDGATSWFRVAAWGPLGRNAHASFHKGQLVIVHGVLKVVEFALEGGTRSHRAEVRATALGHDLRWGTTTYLDGSRATLPAAPPESAQQHLALPAVVPAPEPARETVPPTRAADWDTALGSDATPF
jgi:single-strand DNA-binding protein